MAARSAIIGLWDDEGFLTGFKMNDRAETLAGLVLTLPCPDGPIAVPGGTTSEVTLASVTIPGGVIGPKGHIRLSMLFSVVNNANTHVVRVKIGGQQVMTFNLQNCVSNEFILRVKNRGSQQSQASNPWGTLTPSSSGTVTTTTVDTSQDQPLIVTAQLGVAGEAFALESMSLEIAPSF